MLLVLFKALIRLKVPYYSQLGGDLYQVLFLHLFRRFGLLVYSYGLLYFPHVEATLQIWSESHSGMLDSSYRLPDSDLCFAFSSETGSHIA